MIVLQIHITLVLYNSQFLVHSSQTERQCESVCVVCVSVQPSLTNKHMLIMKEITDRSSSTLPLKKEQDASLEGISRAGGGLPTILN